MGSSKVNNQILNLIDWIISIVLAIILALFIMGNIGFLTKVKGASMEPTFIENDNAILNRVVYRFKEPKKGEIVVLNTKKENNGIIYNMLDEAKGILGNIKYKMGKTSEVNEDNMIKRIVATEGDVVDIEDGILYINGEEESLLSKQGNTYKGIDFDYPLKIEEGYVFVLGDNRENSLDSRILGPIKLEQLKGRVSYIVLPLDRRGKV